MELRKLSVNKVTELSITEKLDLFQFAHTSYAETVYKLLELILIEMRDEAAETDPADEKKQKAVWDVAHAAHKIYTRFRQEVQKIAEGHRADIADKANKEILEDQQEMERIMLNQ